MTRSLYEKMQRLSFKERNLCDNEEVQKALCEMISRGDLQQAFFVLNLFERPQVLSYKGFNRLCLVEGAQEAESDDLLYVVRLVNCFPRHDGVRTQILRERFLALAPKLQKTAHMAPTAPTAPKKR